MGKVAGAAAATHIKQLLKAQPEVAVIFASAPSQIEALAALRADPEVEWHRVTAFHMDEYVGMPESHPASFRRFLKQHLLDHVPVKAFYGLSGEAADATAECARYAALLEEHAPQFVILGIGENGHLAFNDPPVADFNDPLLVKEVTLDEVCRHQQVHDGAFPTLDDVPRTALTLTVPALMRVPRAIVVVPGPMKKHAVKAALEGPLETACPASILRTHPNATLFLDHDSASLL
jgi:glucosamine-6-phosphate deaminase